MAILTKAMLRTAIDSVFASSGQITAEQARGEFHDWIDSLLDAPAVVAGSGITVSQNAREVTIAAGGAAAASGIPSFVAASAAQPSDDVLTATIAGVSDSPPFPSVVYLLTPSGLDRAADNLELQINGDTSRVRELVDFRGNALAARDLDPSALYELLAHASPTQQYRLTEPIPLRLQDFDIVLGWFVDVPFGDNDIAAGDTFDTPDVTIPTLPVGAFSNPSYLILGLPETAPPPARFARTNPEGTELELHVATTLNALDLDVGGVPFTWFQVGPAGGLNAPGVAGRTYRVIYGDYV